VGRYETGSDISTDRLALSMLNPLSDSKDGFHVFVVATALAKIAGDEK